MRATSILLLAASLCVPALGQIAVGAANPYFEDFESGPGGWSDPSGLWEHGMPTATTIDSAASGVNCWATDLDAPYSMNNSLNTLEASFDFSGLTASPILTMKIFHDSQMGIDGVDIEIGVTFFGFVTYSPLGSSSDPNWYNTTNVWALMAEGWSGPNSGWTTVSHEMPGLNGWPEPIIIRIRFGTDATGLFGDGFAVDDISIAEPQPNYPGTPEGFTSDLQASYVHYHPQPFMADVGLATDILPIAAGDLLEWRLLTLAQYILDGQLVVLGSAFTTGAALPTLFPGIWLEPSAAFVLNPGIPGVPDRLPPAVGWSFLFQHPGAGLAGTSISIQGIVSTSAASNGIFASSHALEVRLM